MNTYKIQCPNCYSTIAVDENTIWTIDCDCGKEVTIENSIWEHKKDKLKFKDTKQWYRIENNEQE